MFSINITMDRSYLRHVGVTPGTIQKYKEELQKYKEELRSIHSMIPSEFELSEYGRTGLHRVLDDELKLCDFYLEHHKKTMVAGWCAWKFTEKEARKLYDWQKDDEKCGDVWEMTNLRVRAKIEISKTPTGKFRITTTIWNENQQLTFTRSMYGKPFFKPKIVTGESKLATEIADLKADVEGHMRQMMYPTSIKELKTFETLNELLMITPPEDES